VKYFAAISQILNIWLLDLQEGGVDLACYGAEVKALHLAGNVDNSFKRLHWRRLSTVFELVSFSYGPHLGGWQFWFSEQSDGFSGEFGQWLRFLSAKGTWSWLSQGLGLAIFKELALSCQSPGLLEDFLLKG
jgi:hypothetical protein